MKTITRSLLLLGCAAAAYAVYAAYAQNPGNARAAAICGDLGVLNVDIDQLPEGVSPADLRMCADHPNGRVRVLDPAQGTSLAPMDAGAPRV
ncbi:hypothetical protein LX32DRAFT_641656 [Colletotrichum zoysiae]|uniref:Uncharacterized protein n=1 Tax=Colletotrichum zoysiae TaxID=1216348 RepID=A0AAD9HET2_9PEZI|nr:hypothetical protein LX32DRAFT_641656 [Colletotrichum zoysiae]